MMLADDDDKRHPENYEESDSSSETDSDDTSESELEELGAEKPIPATWPRECDALRFPNVERLAVQMKHYIIGDTKVTENALYVTEECLFIHSFDHYDTYRLRDLCDRPTESNKRKLALLNNRLEQENRTTELTHLLQALKSVSRKRSRSPESTITFVQHNDAVADAIMKVCDRHVKKRASQRREILALETLVSEREKIVSGQLAELKEQLINAQHKVAETTGTLEECRSTLSRLDSRI
ncbi:hypothetical protein HDU87_001736 [Geranomyces variabilis]|uniref:Uncharacterized protein n=1 Tax=Geranomyces variabilis TaxID=109894 RepID=A0AAD5TC58_9FUNG|nr:hypothetical protein HDU87_001736 [Geranomyces variabilis]